ncbi:glycosyl transferase [Chlorobium phaeovibrioides]|uniref:Glycosyl transferase n=1 Tax=Chlorobium phaeovibrioides TaxID=1094 RepID=A0A432AVV3_CHLPH|nr:glycosyltransferase [Chlorobium phaeovibrioides]RTY38366.1 glycosyl transferase [Chlorobium phaeovibrioides]
MPLSLLLNPTVLIPFIATAAVSLLLVLTKSWHGRHSLDSFDGVQKFHHAPTPRIGGVALFAGLLVAWRLSSGPSGTLLALMLLAGLPAFAAGLLEDLTKKVGVRERLLATILSGLFAWWLTGYALNRVEILGVDLLLAYLPVSIAFTAFAVGGIANSINIIDGFNGLAGGTLIIGFTTLGMIAFRVGDLELVWICSLMIAVLAGFMLLNFPFGKLFMGDGGAYFMGFLLAWVAVMLPMRNLSVSKWASLVACGYPLIETLFSMGRRYLNNSDPGQPDSDHLHSLIKVKVVRRLFGSFPPGLRNAMVSPFCWLFSLALSAAAVSFYADKMMLVGCFIAGFLLYSALYWVLTGTPDSCMNSSDD